MRAVSLPLVRKELRQNALVYLAPAVFWLPLIYLRLQGALRNLPAWLDSVVVLAVPLTLAVAFGLQAFDIEVDRQTRDFLLVKPLSARRIAAEKYLLGLAVLFVWIFLFLWVYDPSYLEWPEPLPVSTWLAGLSFLWAVVAYGLSFYVGLAVPGPKKLLAAAVAGALGICWAFFAWSSWNTFFMHRPALAINPGLRQDLFFAAGLAVLFVSIGACLQAAVWFLRGRPRLRLGRPPLVYPVLALVFLAVGLILNLYPVPPLRAAGFLGLELFNLEPSFWCASGAWRPGAMELAVAGPDGALGLARLGRKPRVILARGTGENKPLEDLAWSPDGRYLAYCRDGRVYVLRLGDREPVLIGEGSSPCWARTSDSLLFADARTAAFRTDAPMAVRAMLLRRADLRTGKVAPYIQLQTFGKNWYWESTRDLFLVVRYDGYLFVSGRDGGDGVALPDPDLSRGGLIWHRIYPVPGRDAEYIVATVNLLSAEAEECVVRFFRFDLGTGRATLIKKLPPRQFSNLILDPGSGLCLVGIDGVYEKIALYEGGS